jgi:hypothetical protein
MILPDCKTYSRYPTRTSARTVVVSLPTLAATHPSLITHENLPLPTNLRPRSSPFVLFPQTLSPPPDPNLREIPIEYP